jgi:xanthine dehydrogenase small subunit
LLSALREELGLRSVKDGCSPQGQCGCCTVLVDGVARVACVTAVRRVAGSQVTTVDGLDPTVRDPLVAAIVARGGSQCGFCTPGIVCRLAALGPDPDPGALERALLAHLCRCTGWRGLLAAGRAWQPASPASQGIVDPEAAYRRAALEGGTAQTVGTEAALGRAGFADDLAPPGAMVAVPSSDGGWSIGETLAAARAGSGWPPGRRSGRALSWPVALPEGDWAVRLQTTWVEPAYLEPDASWCRPGGIPASSTGNGGAFGAKRDGRVGAAARRLADEYGRPVRVLYTREDVVRLGPKRPPVAIGLRADGSGVVRVARTDGIVPAITAAGRGLVVEEVDVAGPPTSSALRAAGWAEVTVALAGLAASRDGRVGGGVGAATVTSPLGACAEAEVHTDGAGAPTDVRVSLSCGPVLDEVVVRSYAVGAAHMALGWVLSEGLAVDERGVPVDLTIRSFGVLRARDTPPIEIRLLEGGAEPVNGSDAVFAAVAAATWIALGLPPRWPIARAVAVS